LDSFEPENNKNDKDIKNIYSTFSSHIDKLKIDTRFIIMNDNMYILNNNFHITTLFTGAVSTGVGSTGAVSTGAVSIIYIFIYYLYYFFIHVLQYIFGNLCN
jgi:hypothetical protein